MVKARDRQEAIRGLLVRQGRLTVHELALRLEVTTMTIRRDLAAMEKAGLLTRTHGGCVLRASFALEMPFARKSLLHTTRKVALAREVAARIEPGSTIYLDTGTTATEVARALPADLAVRVFTNNLAVAMELFGRQCAEVVVYGGTLARQSPDLTGEIALERLRDFRLDVAVIGADAIDAVCGEFYSADAATAVLSRQAQCQSDRTFLVADLSKFGKSSLACAGRIDPKVVVFTNGGIARHDRIAIEGAGAELVLADEGTKPSRSDFDTPQTE